MRRAAGWGTCGDRVDGDMHVVGGAGDRLKAEQRADMVEDGLIDVSQYARVIGRRKWLILAVTLLGLLMGGAAAHFQPKNYVASAQVSVNAVSSSVVGGSLDNPQVNMATQRQVATSTAVANLVRQQLKTSASPGALLANLQVTAPAKATTLIFACTASKPHVAQQVAQAFATAYLSQRAAQAQAALGKSVEVVKSQLAAVDAKLAQVQAALATAPRGSAAYDGAQALLSALNPQDAGLRTRLSQLTSLVIDPGQVIAPAPLPTQASGLGKSVYLAAGAVLGLVLGLVLAFLYDRRDDRLHRAGDVEGQLGLPLLAVIPRGRRARPTLDEAAPPEQLEAYGALVARVEVLGRAGCRVIVITSPCEDGVGASVAVNFATGLARSGRRVSLVLADRADTMAVELLPGRQSGDGRGAGERQPHAPVPGLRLIGPEEVGIAGRLLNPDHVRELFEDLKGRNNYVVVSAAPVLVASDTLVLCSAADGVLLAATRGSTRYGDIAAAQNELRRVGARLIGVLVQGERLPRTMRRRLARRHDAFQPVPVLQSSAEAKPIPAIGAEAGGLERS